MKALFVSLLALSFAAPAMAKSSKIYLTPKKKIEASEAGNFSLQAIAAAQMDTSDEFNYSGFQVCFKGDSEEVEQMIRTMADNKPRADILELVRKDDSVSFRFKWQNNDSQSSVSIGLCK